MNSVEPVVIDKQQTSLEAALQKNIQGESLRDCVKNAMEEYFRQLDEQVACDIYDMVLQEIEAPLLEIVMEKTHRNQTQASKILGLNRGTLRKKLKRYNLL
ncbi:MAG: Fis family transcriptional regulator [Cellvibrionaceae bacterium]|jgi:Fis family transcriptional regulator